MMVNERSDNELDDASHQRVNVFSSWKHERNVVRSHRLTREDLNRLDEFWDRWWILNNRHKAWFDMAYGGTCLYKVKSYTDPKILEKFGEECSIESHALYEEWLKLRWDMEEYLESKDLPLTYGDYKWNKPAVGVESLNNNYDGTMTNTGFDYGPARWCANTLQGMKNEIYSRRRMQKIETYTKLGLTIGILGFAVGIISLCI
jgi:hypothetical protein